MDERLSWPGWLTYSGRFTHINGHPSAAGRAQDRESSPAKDRRSTTVPRKQPRKLHITLQWHCRIASQVVLSLDFKCVLCASSVICGQWRIQGRCKQDMASTFDSQKINIVNKLIIQIHLLTDIFCIISNFMHWASLYYYINQQKML